MDFILVPSIYIGFCSRNVVAMDILEKLVLSPVSEKQVILFRRFINHIGMCYHDNDKGPLLCKVR